jgi:hypothetical protein
VLIPQFISGISQHSTAIIKSADEPNLEYRNQISMTQQTGNFNLHLQIFNYSGNGGGDFFNFFSRYLPRLIEESGPIYPNKL